MSSSPTIWSSLTEHLDLARSLRKLQIHFHPERCTGVWQCYEVCPIGLWQPDYQERVVVLKDITPCIACGACVLQCPQEAIELKAAD
jgi:NAD-dependent dihydropyrimidine dehydrogenase PreA subunit